MTGPRGLALTLLLALSPITTTRTAAEGDARTKEYRFLMGTSVSVEAFGGDEADRRAAVAEAFAAVAEVDRLMSNYRDDSELALINGRAAREPVRVSDPMLSVLQAAQEVSARSEGVFDITVGPLVRLWGFHDRQPHVPTPVELERVRGLIGYRNLVIDSGAHTVRFRRDGVELDLGGIAKGFAVELAAGVLRRHGLAGFIDAGGNQFLLGHPPGKTTWTIEIKNPDSPDRLLGVLDLSEGSVSTSAQYANSLVAGARQYGHILDPRTLQPSEGALSVTVVCPDATLADAMSKVGFMLGPAKGLAVIESFPESAAVIAFRKAGGAIGVAVSPRLTGRFHTATGVGP
jgi:thiamine biosynthesis lipoprotein